MMIPFAIAAIESEDDRAFMTSIYLRHRALMLKTAWHFTREPGEVDDIVSETCVMLIQHLDTLKGLEETALRSYIVTTVKHKAVDFRRRSEREKDHAASFDEEQAEPAVSFEHKIAVQAEIDMVKRVLLSLPKREREALTMKFFEGMDDHEIAQTLGISEGAVRKYIMQGRNHLKAALYEGGEDV